jgi:hypothetical protein
LVVQIETGRGRAAGRLQRRLINLDGNEDKPRAAEPGSMAAKRHTPKQRAQTADHDKMDRELDAWMDRALGVRKPDPEPVVRDL